jgi:hypothetical protein
MVELGSTFFLQPESRSAVTIPFFASVEKSYPFDMCIEELNKMQNFIYELAFIYHVPAATAVR